MRIIEGSVDEIVEYQSRTGALSETVGVAAPDELPNGNEPTPARTVSTGSWSTEDEFYIKQFIYSRATEPETTARVLRYVNSVADLGTTIGPGVSERSEDGLTDYLMIHDDGPKYFGAVAYVKPGNGGLSLRLRPEHIEQYMTNDRVKKRDVAESQKYAINCPLTDDDAVDLAIKLTERALELVRAKE
jgi:hypothetical protein